MELRSAGIRVWFFPRNDTPIDVSDTTNTSSPDPSSWGRALADFPSTDCDITKDFKNQSIIANIDLCGSWAARVDLYTTQDQCPSYCENLVTTDSSAFTEAYWEFKSFRVYKEQEADSGGRNSKDRSV